MSCIAAMMLASPALCAAADAATSAASTAPTASPAPSGGSGKTLISLLLPLNAPDFSAPAGAVQKGCEAALALHASTISLETARTTGDPGNIGSAWIAAAERGAGVIVGPLTRSAVTALAAMLTPIPPNRTALPAQVAASAAIARAPITLALNTPEDAPVLPLRFYTFGLVIEQEARAVARMAWSDGRRASFVVQSRNPLARRSSQAYAAEWLALGGRIIHIDDVDASTDLDELKSRFARPPSPSSESPAETHSDMIFLSTDANEARRVRPYLNNQTAVYATSLVNDGRQDAGANVDLAGIRFVDMPWMLQPDHPAVMVYPRPDYASPELQRFYALGVDACRVAAQLLTQSGRMNLDGVTGRLSLSPVPGEGGSAVAREPMLAVFADSSASSPPPADLAQP